MLCRKLALHNPDDGERWSLNKSVAQNEKVDRCVKVHSSNALEDAINKTITSLPLHCSISALGCQEFERQPKTSKPSPSLGTWLQRRAAGDRLTHNLRVKVLSHPKSLCSERSSTFRSHRIIFRLALCIRRPISLRPFSSLVLPRANFGSQPKNALIFE
jgi:hypothetical protein